MDPVADLARLLAPGEHPAGVRLRQGKIISVAADGTATITIGGDSTQVSGVAVASHVPAVPGVACWLAVHGRDAFVIATIGPAVAATTPTGVVLTTAAASAPAGWLLCDGAAVSRTAYAQLFNVIGVTFGVGDGSTTFNLPDMRGRVAVGLDPSQTEFDALGEAGGGKTHTLTTSEMPSHTHTQNAHTHTNTLGNATVASSTHAHPLSDAGAAAIDVNSGYVTERRVGTPAWSSTIRAAGATSLLATSFTTGAALIGSTDAANAATTVAINNASSTATNQNAGGGGAHNNLQPYRVLNHIIKT